MTQPASDLGILTARRVRNLHLTSPHKTKENIAPQGQIVTGIVIASYGNEVCPAQ